MTHRKSLALAALVAAIFSPGFALAQGCHADKIKDTASSCASGQVWDETLGLCVAQPSS